MESLIKFLPLDALLVLLQLVLVKVGSKLKDKDANSTGKDDAFGNVLIAAAPAVQAFGDKSDNSFKKALKAVRDTIDGYLSEPS
jgi:hypothetical protein